MRHRTTGDSARSLGEVAAAAVDSQAGPGAHNPVVARPGDNRAGWRAGTRAAWQGDTRADLRADTRAGQLLDSPAGWPVGIRAAELHGRQLQDNPVERLADSQGVVGPGAGSPGHRGLA